MTRRSILLIAVAALAGVALVAALITAQTPAKDQPVARVGDEVISSDAVRDALGIELAKLEDQIYEMKRRQLNELIDNKLLEQEASQRGIATDELLKVEVEQKLEAISEEEIEVLYEANKDRFKGTEEDLRRQIRAYLTERERRARRQLFVRSLREKADVAIFLEPPEPYRAEVSAEGAPFRGSEAAPVTIVKFEDFHCPFCRRVQSTLAQLMLRYGEDLRIVHRDFPLDSLHPQARIAHVAARCADEQGQFWAYHDVLFNNPPTAEKEQFMAFAEEVGLNQDAFQTCLESEKYKEAIQQDVDTGMKLGLTGTPAFFINGRLVSGAQPMEEFEKVIDQELKRGS